jgi:hypothetical protein
MMLIQPQFLQLSKLLNGRLFRIPEYQRAYSWTSRQRTDLFSDIRKAHEKGNDEGHFMAAVVCLRRESQTLGTDEFHVVDVVDGQQRLTTLIILFKAIALALDPLNKAETKLIGEITELLVKVEGEELLLLQTNHDASHHFSNYLRQGIAPLPDRAKTVADREILQAIQDCKIFVEAWKAKTSSLSNLVALLKNRLFFLLHEIDDEKSVYTVFEVLNSRGLDVSWIDRLKSILMGSAFELKNANNDGIIADLHKCWRDIYAVIGLRQGLSTEALRFAATLSDSQAPSRPLGEQDSVELLKSKAVDATQIRRVANWLLDVARACDEITANPRLNAVTRISQARLLAVAIISRSDISASQRKSLLSRWEKVTFRIYGLLANDARTRVGEYVRLAWRVTNEKLSVEAIGKAISAIGHDFPIGEAVDGLREGNCYEGWERELRYFMFRYEEHLAKEQGLNFSNEQWEKIWMVSPSDSIEHIWAQSKAPAKQKHRLGNLVLLPPKLNSRLQDLAPRNKLVAYRQTGLLIVGEVVDVIGSGGWTRESIESREAALVEWARVEWAD